MSDLQTENQIEHLTRILIPYAYNILGSMPHAEDITQDVLAHFFTSGHDHVKNTEGYLVRSVVNRAINEKNQLRNRLEQYPGDWLPIPVSTHEYIYDGVDKPRILNYSLMVLLEKLNTLERAVFILKNFFDFSHPDIAGMLDIKEDRSRQLLKRAKEKIEFRKGARRPLGQKDKELLQDLAEAMAGPDLTAIKRLLTDKTEAVSDGGPHVSAARNVLVGPDRIAKLLKAISTKYFLPGTEVELTVLNHQPAVLYRQKGRVYRALILETEGDSVRHIYIVVNPDKLQRLRFKV